MACLLDRLVALAERARSGAPDAIEDLIRASAPYAHTLARARLGDRLSVSEAATDALARAARGIARLRDPRAYPHWLRRVVSRCATDVSRRTPRAAAELPPRADPGPGPVDTLVARERAAAVKAAVARLPIRQREVVLLHFVEDFSYREIAAAIGAGLGTVARRMEKALAVLRTALEEKE